MWRSSGAGVAQSALRSALLTRPIEYCILGRLPLSERPTLWRVEECETGETGIAAVDCCMKARVVAEEDVGSGAWRVGVNERAGADSGEAEEEGAERRRCD